MTGCLTDQAQRGESSGPTLSPRELVAEGLAVAALPALGGVLPASGPSKAGSATPHPSNGKRRWTMRCN